MYAGEYEDEYEIKLTKNNNNKNKKKNVDPLEFFSDKTLSVVKW